MITEAYKEDALSRAQVFRWFNEFKNGRESVEDMERSGRPSTSRVDETVAKVPQGKTVNAEFYKEVLQRLHKAVKRKRQDLAQRWRLHHDNAPAHTAFLVTSYLTRIGVEVLPQPPYSPDMSPPDFFLFPKVKRCLKGHRFDDIPCCHEGTNWDNSNGLQWGL